MSVFARKVFDWIRERITYQQFLATLLLCTFVLGYFVWPTFSRIFIKQRTYDLDLPPDTIPFLLIEKEEKNQLLSSIYLAFWDLSLGTIYKDDAEPICEVTGEIGDVFWSGNKKIILTPNNERGSLEVNKLLEGFSVHTYAVPSDKDHLIKYSYSGNKLYFLSLDSKTGVLEFSYQQGRKQKKVVVSHLDGFPSYQLIKPIFFVPENLKPVVYCLVQKSDKPEEGIGVMIGTLYKERFSWELWREVDPSLTSDSIADCSFFQENVAISNKNKLQIQHISQQKIFNLSSANNYLNMFHFYLFGDSNHQSIVNRQGIELLEQEFVPPSMNCFHNVLILNWTPSFTSNSDFYIRQVLALRNTKMVGKIELMGKNVKVYKDSVLISEQITEDRYLKNRWIFPND